MRKPCVNLTGVNLKNKVYAGLRKFTHGLRRFRNFRFTHGLRMVYADFAWFSHGFAGLRMVYADFLGLRV